MKFRGSTEGRNEVKNCAWGHIGCEVEHRIVQGKRSWDLIKWCGFREKTQLCEQLTHFNNGKQLLQLVTFSRDQLCHSKRLYSHLNKATVSVLCGRMFSMLLPKHLANHTNNVMNKCEVQLLTLRKCQMPFKNKALVMWFPLLHFIEDSNRLVLFNNWVF